MLKYDPLMHTYVDTKARKMIGKKKAKELMAMKDSKPIKINKHHYPKKRRSPCVKKLVVRQYKDGSYDFHTGAMNDEDLLYYAHMIEKNVDVCMEQTAKRYLRKHQVD